VACSTMRASSLGVEIRRKTPIFAFSPLPEDEKPLFCALAPLKGQYWITGETRGGSETCYILLEACFR
jgi:hypothetical protein